MKRKTKRKILGNFFVIDLLAFGISIVRAIRLSYKVIDYLFKKKKRKKEKKITE